MIRAVPAVVLLLLSAATHAETVTQMPAPATAPLELARVNGEVVTDADLKAAFVGKHGGHTVFLGGDTETRRFLDIVINEKLLVQEGYNLGLDADPTVKPLVDELRATTAADRLLKMEIEEKAEPTAAEIREAWELADELFLAREIVVDTKAEAESLRRSLLLGEDFEAIARACSTAKTRSRGGNIPPFTWGSMSVELEKAVFALEPGELSPVFRTEEGWCIVLLVDRVDAVRPPLDEKVSARIAMKLKERKKAARTTEFSAELWKRYEAKILAADVTPHALGRLLAAAPDTVIATWNGGSLLAKNAFTAGEVRMFSTFVPAKASLKIDETLRAAVNTALVRLAAKERKIDELPDVAAVVDKYEAKLIESVLYSKHVLTGVKVDDDEVRAAYEKQKDSLLIGEKRRVAHIAVATENEAKKLAARLTRGEDFVELLKAHTLDKPGLKNEGDLGWIEKGKVAEIYDPLFELPVGGVAPPVQSSSAWHLVRVTAIEPEHPLSFDEVKEKIRATLLEKKKHDLRERWIAQLRQAGEIEVIDSAVQAFVKLNPYEDPNK